MKSTQLYVDAGPGLLVEDTNLHSLESGSLNEFVSVSKKKRFRPEFQIHADLYPWMSLSPFPDDMTSKVPGHSLRTRIILAWNWLHLSRSSQFVRRNGCDLNPWSMEIFFHEWVWDPSSWYYNAVPVDVMACIVSRACWTSNRVALNLQSPF